MKKEERKKKRKEGERGEDGERSVTTSKLLRILAGYVHPNITKGKEKKNVILCRSWGGRERGGSGQIYSFGYGGKPWGTS